MSLIFIFGVGDMSISEIFGTMVFNESVMRQVLPDDVFMQLHNSINDGKRLDPKTADVIASAMKDWAISKGATHFAHWFQPMTGITAEKHDSFLSPADDGQVIMDFSGKELIRGEPDASSFPSGGLRATFEARGYTAWDTTSYAFIKDNVLCIPTAFYSYGGEALDMKAPLLKSMEAINTQALRVLNLFGHKNVKSIKTMVGAEQEYFLIDKSVFEKRKDLIYTGRTLFGAKPPKGQELADHYFGSIKPRVAAFMKELDEELWKLGIMAKTEHNEGAPSQHELAPVYTTSNIAVDHNQLTMEIMQKVARKYDMVCLLHEKPFEGVSGSGKHNNWSISTDSGINLLDPGDTPFENAQFLLFFCAVMQAVDDYQDLLRLSVASASNDCRICGANEAPPSIVSMFIGDEMNSILSAIENNTAYGKKDAEEFKVGVHALPKFPKDSTDRNRTSPLAFTGNKFEFRMPGSFASLSAPNVVLNTAVAESLRQYADALEKSDDFESDLHALIKDVIGKHRRIIFNGNNYDKVWEEEAASRGLSNLKSTPECAAVYLDEKNISLFSRHNVFTRPEIEARYEIKLNSYCTVMNIESQTMVEMAQRDILPAASRFSGGIADAMLSKKAISSEIDCSYEEGLIQNISKLLAAATHSAKALKLEQEYAKKIDDSMCRAKYYRENVFTAMNVLRTAVDELETVVSSDAWPYPTYGDILFSIS